MTGLRKTLCNNKARWLQRCRQAGADAARYLSWEARTPGAVPLAECFHIAARVRRLGLQAEGLFVQAQQLSLSERVLEDICYGANRLELLSIHLREVAEKGWGGPLVSFPTFSSVLNTCIAPFPVEDYET